MTWSRAIRQVHRWTSLLFALLVAGLFLALALGGPPEWTYFLPLPPLFLLLLTGLWLFAQPYLGRRRRLAAQD
jgi:ABC-type polysaccharide/polyol phosphate export permease